jgi:iron complex transport system substrate-binding protein
MKVRRLLMLVVMLGSSMTLMACTNNTEETTVIVIDMVGDTVEVPLNPSKVAVIARAAADMMIGFGLGESVDGMYYSILNNPWVDVLYPDSEDYYSYDYNESAELFLSREVDLVLAPEQYIAEELREAGINAITVSLYGNPDYGEYLYYLADLIKQIWPDTSEKVDLWSLELDTALNSVTDVLDTQDIPKRTIYYVRGDKDKGIGYTDTGYSLLETIYDKYLNMTYLGRDFESNKPSAEDIMAKNPDVIAIGGIYQNKHINTIKTTEPYKFLDAVVNDQVLSIPIGFVMWEQNSIVLPLFVYDQANKLYPELFSYEINDLIRVSYESYFGVTLTNQQIEYMLDGLGPTGNQMYD